MVITERKYKVSFTISRIDENASESEPSQTLVVALSNEVSYNLETCEQFAKSGEISMAVEHGLVAVSENLVDVAYPIMTAEILRAIQAAKPDAPTGKVFRLGEVGPLTLG